MSNPQQPELARSRKTPSQDQDAVAAVVEGSKPPGSSGPGGPVPEDNQPGHHPAEEQDKPDLEAFAERLGVTDAPADEAAREQVQAQAERAHAPAPSSWNGPSAGGSKTPRLVAVVAGALLVALLFRRRRARRRSKA
jgi:hypothetical protein